MSKNFERAEEILNSFDETPICEMYPVEVRQSSYEHRLDALKNYEILVEQAVEDQRLTYNEAETAINGFISWVNQATN